MLVLVTLNDRQDRPNEHGVHLGCLLSPYAQATHACRQFLHRLSN